MIANCSNSRERWTAQVRLSVKGDRLTWASKRGVQVYTTASRRRKTESAIAASIRCMSCSEEGGPRSQPRANASQAGFAREPCSIPLDCSCWNRAGLDARHRRDAPTEAPRGVNHNGTFNAYTWPPFSSNPSARRNSSAAVLRSSSDMRSASNSNRRRPVPVRSAS